MLFNTGYVSQYKQLSMQERDVYKRCARIRHYAKANKLVMHKLRNQDKYLICDSEGNTEFYTLKELEDIVQSVRGRYKTSTKQR